MSITSVSCGAVTALHSLAEELGLAGRINRAIVAPAGKAQVRDALPVGESLVAAMIGRACAPRRKRAFADWAKTTYLPELMHFVATDLTSQHFWDQMNSVPVDKLAAIEQELVREVVRIEQLQLQALAYDTTNFRTHIASTNSRPKLPQRGKNKQGRHDLRQMGLAPVVDQVTQLPLAHVLYEGARSDMKTFAEFLKPKREDGCFPYRLYKAYYEEFFPPKSNGEEAPEPRYRWRQCRNPAVLPPAGTIGTAGAPQSRSPSTLPKRPKGQTR